MRSDVYRGRALPRTSPAARRLPDIGGQGVATPTPPTGAGASATRSRSSPTKTHREMTAPDHWNETVSAAARCAASEHGFILRNAAAAQANIYCCWSACRNQSPVAAAHISITMVKRAPRGSSKNTIGIYVALDPEIYQAYVKAAADRDITKRRLVVGALLRELADPTVTSRQETFYDVA